MFFDYIEISNDKTPQENLRIIKSYMDNLVDQLNMLSQQIEDNKEGEGK
ncbi:MAG: hypothetical protein J6P79_01565 [Pseudobutyrivibrio sp.]|jgi:hypothetical protein|nr:hypothetical protein [Pseudobutyrivibrio sp.]